VANSSPLQLNQTTFVSQLYNLSRRRRNGGEKTKTSLIANIVTSADSLLVIASNFTLVGNSGASSGSSYTYKDGDMNCFSRTISSQRNSPNVTFVNGNRCAHNKNHLKSDVDPFYGYPLVEWD
jgi:hypothetical protein